MNKDVTGDTYHDLEYERYTRKAWSVTVTERERSDVRGDICMAQGRARLGI